MTQPRSIPTPPLRIVSIDPCRIVDTRSATMPSGYGLPNLIPGEARPFILTGQSHCLIPETALGVVLNVTAVAAEGNGNLRLYPTGASTPATSTVNFRAGVNTANAAIMALGEDGGLNVLASFAATGVVLDVTGYLIDGGTSLWTDNEDEGHPMVTTNAEVVSAPAARVGIGTTDPQNSLHIHAWNGGIHFTDGSDPDHSWILAGNNQYGNFSLLHDTDYALLVDSTRNTFLYGDLTINGTGYSGGGWQQTSDVRLKNHVVTLEGALDRVLRLRGVEFEWNREGERAARLPAGRQIGLIAQEVEAVVPEVVSTDKEGYKAMASSNLTGLLVEAIKEQQEVIERQAGQIEEQRQETASLAAHLARLEKALPSAAE